MDRPTNINTFNKIIQELVQLDDEEMAFIGEKLGRIDRVIRNSDATIVAALALSPTLSSINITNILRIFAYARSNTITARTDWAAIDLFNEANNYEPPEVNTPVANAAAQVRSEMAIREAAAAADATGTAGREITVSSPSRARRTPRSPRTPRTPSGWKFDKISMPEAPEFTGNNSDWYDWKIAFKRQLVTSRYAAYLDVDKPSHFAEDIDAQLYTVLHTKTEKGCAAFIVEAHEPNGHDAYQALVRNYESVDHKAEAIAEEEQKIAELRYDGSEPFPFFVNAFSKCIRVMEQNGKQMTDQQKIAKFFRNITDDRFTSEMSRFRNTEHSFNAIREAFMQHDALLTKSEGHYSPKRNRRYQQKDTKDDRKRPRESSKWDRKGAASFRLPDSVFRRMPVSTQVLLVEASRHFRTTGKPIDEETLKRNKPADYARNLELPLTQRGPKRPRTGDHKTGRPGTQGPWNAGS